MSASILIDLLFLTSSASKLRSCVSCLSKKHLFFLSTLKMSSEEVSTKRTTSISLAEWFYTLRTKTRRSSKKPAYECEAIPHTLTTRLRESLNDTAIDTSELTQNIEQNAARSKQTVLYLAYGSNLCRETFRGKRGIRPISQINVLVPELVMTFDLPGVPYTEPCFGNTRYRQRPKSEDSAEIIGGDEYHKDAWHKGLVGEVYEVTLADYAHIIATEGGGASYKDVLVECYTLPTDPRAPVPIMPTGSPFKAHTLFAPGVLESRGGRLVRPNPSYAQPSPRYLKLITDGADELTLPYEYQSYLHALHGYQITTTKQRLGQFIFLSVWGPLLAFIFGAGRMFADKNGRYPPWLTTLAANIFIGMWKSYDNFFKRLFGDGERTMGSEQGTGTVDEKQSLLLDSRNSIDGDVLRDSFRPDYSMV
jgi:hypothetical protein